MHIVENYYGSILCGVSQGWWYLPHYQVVVAALRKEHLDRLNHTLTVGQHACLMKLWEDDSSCEDGDDATY